VFKLLGARPDYVDLAWQLAEQKVIEIAGKGSAAEIADRLLVVRRRAEVVHQAGEGGSKL
jgi:hypothetical protein